MVCLIGPSGSGKSTLLRCTNGLELIDGGEIRRHQGSRAAKERERRLPHQAVAEAIAAEKSVQKR